MIFRRVLDQVFKQIEYFLIRFVSEYSKQARQVNFPFSVYFDGYYTLFIRFDFEPRTSFRDDFCRAILRSQRASAEKYARRSYQLAYHDSFDSVYYKSSRIRHQRDSSQENILLLNFPRFFID